MDTLVDLVGTTLLLEYFIHLGLFHQYDVLNVL
jgi:hypothetical protein